jgi:hypothetical protein
MDVSTDKPGPLDAKVESAKAKAPLCNCVEDPFAALPPELRPRQRSWMDDFRQVTCPECGLIYWTNRKTDLCAECEKKSVKPLEIKS